MFKDQELGWRELTILMVIAYLFSFAIRLIWVFEFQDTPSFFWNEQLMINTNDGYFFASALEYLLTGSHSDNPRVGIAIASYPGMVYASYILTKFTPMSLETAILYAPSIISSLVVIPIILTGKLIKLPWVGFFAALLGSIAWSYYNRTMTGYYDSDMFSVFLQFTVLYLFLLTIYIKNDKNVLLLAFTLLIYPFFYPQGLSLVYAIFIIWALYQLIFQREEQNSYLFIIVASVSLWMIPIWLKAVLIIVIFIFLEQFKNRLDNKKFFYLALGSLLIFLLFGNVFNLIWSKITMYLGRGVQEEGLHFYQVIQTVREAGSISWETVANRVIGSPVLFILSIIGYIALVFKHREFLIAIPLFGIGIFAHWAGLRFTVYAVPMAAFSLIYLSYFISQQVKDKRVGYAVFIILSLLPLYPNISHILGYKVPTVLNKMEVTDLEKLDKIANSKDYTLAWWDYGYPIWFYSDTSTLIDGAKHHNDNFIISKIFTTDSQIQAANLARLSVETYVDSNYSNVADTIFKNHKKDQLNPNVFLDKLKNEEFKLPNKSRDIYFYLPYKMLNIFPTVSAFSNLDLTTGKRLKQSFFYSTSRFSEKGNLLNLSNGLVLDKQNSMLTIGKNKTQLKRLVVLEFDKAGKLKKNVQNVNPNSNISIIFMKSYNTFLVLDESMYNSLYVKLFVLEEFDPKLFELVISSPYSKIYKLKI